MDAGKPRIGTCLKMSPQNLNGLTNSLPTHLPTENVFPGTQNQPLALGTRSRTTQTACALQSQKSPKGALAKEESFAAGVYVLSGFSEWDCDDPRDFDLKTRIYSPCALGTSIDFALRYHYRSRYQSVEFYTVLDMYHCTAEDCDPKDPRGRKTAPTGGQAGGNANNSDSNDSDGDDDSDSEGDALECGMRDSDISDDGWSDEDDDDDGGSLGMGLLFGMGGGFGVWGGGNTRRSRRDVDSDSNSESESGHSDSSDDRPKPTTTKSAPKKKGELVFSIEMKGRGYYVRKLATKDNLGKAAGLLFGRPGGLSTRKMWSLLAHAGSSCCCRPVADGVERVARFSRRQFKLCEGESGDGSENDVDSENESRKNKKARKDTSLW